MRSVVVARPSTEAGTPAFGAMAFDELVEELSDRGPTAEAVGRRSAGVPDSDRSPAPRAAATRHTDTTTDEMICRIKKGFFRD